MEIQNVEAKRSRLKPGSKKAGVLRVLLERAEGLNRFQAESLCHDHVLPSTISDLCRDFGLEIPRKLETVPGHAGKPTECARYRLSDADAVKVRGLLNPAELQAQSVEDAERWARAVRAQERELRDRAERGGRV